MREPTAVSMAGLPSHLILKGGRNMSLQNVVGFWQKVQTDVALRDQVILTNRDEGLRRIVQIAGQNGFDFTQAEMLEAEAVLAFWQRVQSDSELQARLKQTR